MKTGIQVSSFQPVLTTEAEVKTAFDKMKAMGCKWVQLQWIDPSVPIDFIASCLRETGIRSVSVQDFYEVIRQNKPYYMELNARTGGTWMCVSRIPERLKSRAGLDEYVAELRAFQQELEAVGQKLCFHAVGMDFAPIGGIDPVAYLLDAMPELAICVDFYNIRKAGQHSLEYLHRYAGRVCMVHFKDSAVIEGTEHLVPAGQGDTDWTGVVKVCAEIGVKFGFVEQERWLKDPFDCMREALHWLNAEACELQTETVTLKIPGFSRTYTFYHTSDCHLAWAAPEEGEAAMAKAKAMTDAWSYTGLLPADALRKTLQIVREDEADGLFLCGDVADYLSDGVLKTVRESLNSTPTPKYYVCGNHERSGVQPPDSRDFYPAYQDLMRGSPGFWRVDFGEFMLVGIDNGDKRIREEQLECLKQTFEMGKPLLILIHIPIVTEAIMEPVRKKWGENGPDYFLLGQETDTELSRRFCSMLADPAAPIAAVFAGHIHLAHAGEIIPGRMQYVSAPTFEGVIRKYILQAE